MEVAVKCQESRYPSLKSNVISKAKRLNILREENMNLRDDLEESRNKVKEMK